MTKQNTKQTAAIKQNNAAVAAADNLAAARDCAVAAFKEQGKAAKSLTKTALEFVAAYYAAKKTVELDKDTRAELRAQWAKYNDSKFESGVFYRVAKTCAKNAAYLTPRFDAAVSNAAAAQAARDVLLTLGVGLTSCKSAEESAPTEQATESAPTEQATESATDRLKTVLDFIAVCGDSAFAAIAAAVEKRRAVAEKIAKVG